MAVGVALLALIPALILRREEARVRRVGAAEQPPAAPIARLRAPLWGLSLEWRSRSPPNRRRPGGLVAALDRARGEHGGAVGQRERDARRDGLALADDEADVGVLVQAQRLLRPPAEALAQAQLQDDLRAGRRGVTVASTWTRWPFNRFTIALIV